MCKFCEGLFERGHGMEWNMRGEYADSNFCEKVLDNMCDNCDKCFVQYKLNGWKGINDNMYIQCDYKFDNGNIVMWNSTEPLRINYCPYCGKQLSKDIIDCDDIGDHIIDIVDKNGDTWDYESYLSNKEVK